jgi:hypothetical protein
LLALVLACSYAANASDPPPDFDHLMAALAQRQHGHVTFVERKFLAVLDRPLESSGELFYDAPDRLEKRTVKPRPETLVLAHGVVTAKRGRRTYVLDLREDPQVASLIESIRATLAGDRAALERVFRVTFVGSLENWTLVLKPRDARLTRTVKEFHIEGALDAIHSIEILEADGDRSVMTIGPEVLQ